LVYGNDGHDVLADYHTNLEQWLHGANDLADAIASLPDDARIVQDPPREPWPFVPDSNGARAIRAAPAPGTGAVVNADYFYLSDPGHGWLEVPLRHVHALGIAKTISRYSYLDTTGSQSPFKGEPVAYLEEDCDMARFMEAARAAGWNVTLKERSCTGNCFCRGLPRFEA
jgi:hypothetical protein